MRKSVIVVAAGLAVSSFALADSDWAAAVGGNWSVASNWSPANVPDSLGELATISVGPGAYVVVFDSGMPATTSLAGVVLTNPDLRLDLLGGKTLAIEGTFTNDCMVRLNTNGSSADTILRFDATTLIVGTGTISLERPGGDSQLQTGTGAVLTNGASHLIRGQGTLGAELVNLGTVDANTPAGLLQLVTNNKSNSGTFMASVAGILVIDDITVDNTGGLIFADTGSVVRFPTGTHSVIAGHIDSSGSGIVELQSGGILMLDAVNSSATFNIHGGGTLLVTGGLTQTGTMTVNSTGSSSDAVVRYIASGDLAGAGTLRMNRPGLDSQLLADPGVTLTHASGHTISGRGTIAAALTNNGLIRSDFSGFDLDLTTYDITNNADIQATGGGQVHIKSISIDQTGGGRLLADGGTMRVPLGSAATIIGGDIETLNSGLLQVDLGATLDLVAVTLTGDADILGGGTLNVFAGLTLDGTIVVNSTGSSSDAILNFADSSTVGGLGTILMNRAGGDSQMTTEPAETVTLGAGTLVEGRGQIHAAFVNDGTIESDFSAFRLELLSNDKTNNALIRATGGGIIEINGITLTNTPSGVIHADNASMIDFPVGAHTVNGGTLSTAGSGQARVSTSALVTLDQVNSTGSVNILGGGTLIVGPSGATNNGVIVVNSNASSSDGFLRLSDGSTLDGTGQIILNRPALDSQIFTAAGEAGTLAGDMRVSGQGRIVGDVTIACVLEPGMTSPLSIGHSGTMTFDPAGKYRVRIASTSSHGKFDGSADVTLGGTLNPVFEGGYTPVKNHFFTIITAGSVAGDFDAIDAPPLSGGLVYRVVKTATTVDLRITCGPDLNADGFLDFFDVQFFLQAFATQDPIGDFNNDSFYNFFDVQAFLNAFSTGCP